MDLGIAGRTALVLAGAGGLGSAVARALAAEGARLALADADGDRVTAVAAAVGGDALALRWNLAERGQINKNVGLIEQKLGPVEILVNITGGPPPTPAAGQAAALWQASFEEMVLSVIAITDRVLPGMRERRWGRIITSTSSGVVTPIPNLAISNALRLSLVGWSKSLSREVAPDGVTANVVVPGRILTGRIRYLDEQRAQREGKTVDEISGASTAAIPAGRYGDPAEYAAVVAFLASAAASYVTGTVVRVDGGLVPSV